MRTRGETRFENTMEEHFVLKISIHFSCHKLDNSYINWYLKIIIQIFNYAERYKFLITVELVLKDHLRDRLRQVTFNSSLHTKPCDRMYKKTCSIIITFFTYVISHV